MNNEQNNLLGVEIVESLRKLNEKIDQQGKRIEKLENLYSQKIETINPEVRRESVLVSSQPAPSSQYQELRNDFASGAMKNIPAMEANVSSESAKPKEKINLEENIGGKWFARIGITALVLGVSFLLKYAFDNDWIGETGRIIIGLIIGLILLGLGEKYIRKYAAYGQIITGGGIAVLYLSIFSAFNFYQLITLVPAFFIMMLITGVGIILSLRYNAISLIIVSILGGFITPILISNGQSNQIELLSYILLLDLAILVISFFKKWRELNFLGFFGTVILFSIWAEKFYKAEVLGITMFFLTAFFIVYSISSLIYNLAKKEKSSSIEQTLTLFSATAYFGVSYAILNEDYHLFMGFFALLLAIYYFLWAYLVRVLTSEDESLYNFLAFLTVGFITLAIPIQFEKNVITIGWLIETVVLFYLGIKTKKFEIKIFGLIALALSLVRLFIFDFEHLNDSLPFLNEVFLTFIFATAICYLSAYLFRALRRDDDSAGLIAQSKQLIATLIVVANFLTIVSVSREISFHYEKQIDEIHKERTMALEESKTLKGVGKYNVNSNRENDYAEQIKKINNRGSVMLSIFWLVYSIILLTVGIVGKYKAVRVGGIVLLMLAILKLFFYDLWNLGTLYRIVSSISLGVVLLSISFAYQKYKDKIKEII